jgi:hypothetical protein
LSAPRSQCTCDAGAAVCGEEWMKAVWISTVYGKRCTLLSASAAHWLGRVALKTHTHSMLVNHAAAATSRSAAVCCAAL